MFVGPASLPAPEANLDFHGWLVSYATHCNYKENKVSSFDKSIGRAVPAVESLLVGRASVPANVSPRQQPLLSWSAGDFYKR